MITKPDGIVARLGKSYSPNLDDIVTDSEEALANHWFVYYPKRDWTVVVTNPRCARKKYRGKGTR